MDFNVASFRLGMKENSFTDAVHSPSKVCDLKLSLCSFLVLGLNELQTLAFPILNPSPSTLVFPISTVLNLG
jgi:hypothetical protein